MKNKTLPISILAAGALFTTSLSAQEWTRFRGPNGDGLSDCKTIPASFDEKDFNWKVEVPGEGYSSPVLWGDKIFLTANDKGREGGFLKVLCYSAKDGTKLWEWEEKYAPHHINGKFNNFASTTPVVDAERLYVSWTTGESREVKAFTHDGDEAWQISRAGFDKTDHGSGASPIIAGGVLVIPNESTGSDSSVLGLDPKDGTTVWELQRTNAKDVYSTPMIAKFDGVESLVFVGTSNGFTGVDPKKGTVQWQYNPGFRMRSVGSPVIVGDSVFATLGQGGGGKESAAVRVKGGKAELNYETSTGLPYVPTPVVFEGLMYFLNDAGLLSCVKGADGTKVYDRVRLSEGRSAKWFSSPICVNGVLYCASTDGQMVMVKAGAEYKEVGRFHFGEGVNATPAVAGGKMYIRTAGHLISLGG